MLRSSIGVRIDRRSFDTILRSGPCDSSIDGLSKVQNIPYNLETDRAISPRLAMRIDESG